MDLVQINATGAVKARDIGDTLTDSWPSLAIANASPFLVRSMRLRTNWSGYSTVISVRRKELPPQPGALVWGEHRC